MTIHSIQNHKQLLCQAAYIHQRDCGRLGGVEAEFSWKSTKLDAEWSTEVKNALKDMGDWSTGAQWRKK